MVIEKVNRVSVGTLADFERVVGTLKPGDAVVMNVAVAAGDGSVRHLLVQFTYQ
jgi:hypothetical protein